MRKILFIAFAFITINSNAQVNKCDGFLGLKWYSSIVDAISFFDEKQNLKISSISNEDNFGQKLFLKGKFANYDVETVSITYFSKKMAVVYIIFKDNSNEQYLNLVENYKNKYGQSIKMNSGEFVWHFNDNSKIFIYIDDEGKTNINYISPNYFELEKEHKSKFTYQKLNDI